MPDVKITEAQFNSIRETAAVLAAGYFRLLAIHGPKWRERFGLRAIEKGEESAELLDVPLDYGCGRSMTYAGEKGITLTLTRS